MVHAVSDCAVLKSILITWNIGVKVLLELVHNSKNALALGVLGGQLPAFHFDFVHFFYMRLQIKIDFGCMTQNFLLKCLI